MSSPGNNSHRHPSSNGRDAKFAVEIPVPSPTGAARMANGEGEIEEEVPTIESSRLPVEEIDEEVEEHGQISSGTSDTDVSDDQHGDDADDDDWESESLYEDALHIISDNELRRGLPMDDACTYEEAMHYRRRLRAIGERAFLQETIGEGTITAKKLCTAFKILPPDFLVMSPDVPDEAYYPLLSIGIEREYARRTKLREYNTIDDAVELLKKSQNAIVVTGAGISTSLGIPDFRSKDTGLYSRLENLGLSDPQEVFDIDVFREDPFIFYSIAKDILPSGHRFTPTHAFIRLLQDKGKLLTNYTQNIDNIEANAGILPEKVIQCHGSFATATCIRCRFKVAGEEIFDDVKQGNVAACRKCVAEREAKKAELGVSEKGKRKRRSDSMASPPAKGKSGAADGRKKRRKADNPFSFGDDDDDDDDDGYDATYGEHGTEIGVMKPDITFFGEDLPDAFRQRLVGHDRDTVDLVIVIGTSLKVAPVGDVPGILPRHVPQLFISRDPVSHIEFDVEMLGDCDTVVAELCRRAGWDLPHAMVPAGERVDVQQVPDAESRFRFSVIRPPAAEVTTTDTTNTTGQRE